MTPTEIEKTEKKSADKAEQMTWAARTFEPYVDIFENRDAITIEADMPGVRKEDIDVDLNNDVLTIQGRVALNEYEGLRTVYSEYNIGNYYRRFTLGEVVDQGRIAAKMADGVLTLTLPKREKAVPRKVSVG